MPASLARRGVWIVAAMVVAAVLVVVGLPLVASTQIVRDGIAQQMSAWSGYRVRLDDRPDIRVWPAFRAVLHDVTLSDWDENDPRPVLQAERIEIDLSALAALRGDVVFTKMRLIRPVLRLAREDGALHLPPPQGWGRLSRSVETAREVISVNPANPDTSALPSDAFGEIELFDARVTATEGDTSRDIVTSLSGEFDWPALNRQASISAQGIWRGETVTLKASSAQPLLLLAGGTAPMNFSAQAAPAQATFKGAANFSETAFVDGELAFSAPSLNRLAEWTHAVSPRGSRSGAVTVAARVTGDVTRLKFENATLGFDNSTGKGLIDVGFGPGRPSIAGTLAFDTLNLRALLEAFSPFSSQPPTSAPGSAPMHPRGYDLDLRFSAAKAGLGTVTLTDVAAAAKVKDGLSTFDVSDATAFGGMLQFGLRADKTSAPDTFEIRMMGERINAGEMATALGLKRMVPRAPGNFSMVVKGAGDSLDTVLQTAEGTISADFGTGTVPGLSIDAFLQQSARGDFFPLSALGEAALPIDSASVKASLSQGVLSIDSADAVSGTHRISLDGLVPFVGRGLALYGTLSADPATDPRLKAPLVFFVGGSWSAPYIASFLRPGAEDTGSE